MNPGKYIDIQLTTALHRLSYLIVTVVIILGIAFIAIRRDRLTSDTFFIPEATPWQSIGGCGLGGSGGGGESSVQWLGKGIHGHLVSIEMLPEIMCGSTGGLSQAGLSSGPRISFHPTWQTEISCKVPLLFRIGEVQQQSNFPEEMHLNCGIGDLTAQISHSFGNESSWTIIASATVPTGVYDAQYGPEQSRKILPQYLQTGRGIYGASAGGFHTWTIEDGMVRLGGVFHVPFNVSLDKKNQYLDSYYEAYRDETRNRERFHYPHIIKPYGESDRGDYYPPTLACNVACSRQVATVFVHSLQLSFTANLGVRWVRDYVPTRYAPVPAPDNTAWDGLLFYGIEYSGWHSPVFAGFGLPVSDKFGNDNSWDGIIFQRWLCAAGITVGLF